MATDPGKSRNRDGAQAFQLAGLSLGIREEAGCAEIEPLAPERLRCAFGAFATGIAVIGARGRDGALVGMTANSFTSVSLNPPLVLFCAARSLSAFDAYCTASHFSVSVLPAHREDVSDLFARPGTGKWSSVPHVLGASGVPVLDFALASFECQVVARHDAGDHLIVVGKVLRLRMEQGEVPLIFFRSRYRELSSASRATEPQGDLPFPGWG